MPLPTSISNKKYQGQIYKNIVHQNPDMVVRNIIKKGHVSSMGGKSSNLNADSLNAELKNIAA